MRAKFQSGARYCASKVFLTLVGRAFESEENLDEKLASVQKSSKSDTRFLRYKLKRTILAKGKFC